MMTEFDPRAAEVKADEVAALRARLREAEKLLQRTYLALTWDAIYRGLLKDVGAFLGITEKAGA